MLRFLIASFCFSLTAGKHVLDKEYMVLEEQSEGLVWPERYTVKAIKMSLISDLVEDVVAWKTNQSSRVDYNEGAVKSITILNVAPDNDDNDDSAYGGDDDDDEPSDYKYEIHPESQDSETVSLVCYDVGNAYWSISLDEILPTVEYQTFKNIGNEIITDVKTTKFQAIEKAGRETKKKTIWATNKDVGDDSIWVPVKYELSEYNDVLGSLTNHEVWYFSEFNTEFDDSVFNVEKYNCTEEYMVSHKPFSDMITKELMSVNPENEKHVEHIFNHFKTKFDRKYVDEKEHTLRKGIFKQNMRLISTINRKNLPYKLGINHFADKTLEEVKRKHTGLLRRGKGEVGNVPFPYSDQKLKTIDEELPEEHDLRLLGLVSSVKNQQDCGSCWTYGTTAAVEGALARINGGRLMSLSNQALVDCAWGYGAYGCDGGTDNAAYDWMMKFGLPTVEDYGPYKNKDGYCHIANVTKHPIKGYTDVTPFSSSALKVAVVNHGPLSVSVEVTQQFALYSRGVFYEKDCGPGNLNHEVALVGYGVEDGELFWVLKNSWGVEWGSAGYMQISARDNDCGVATEPTYVVF